MQQKSYIHIQIYIITSKPSTTDGRVGKRFVWARNGWSGPTVLTTATLFWAPPPPPHIIPPGHTIISHHSVLPPAVSFHRYGKILQSEFSCWRSPHQGVWAGPMFHDTTTVQWHHLQSVPHPLSNSYQTENMVYNFRFILFNGLSEKLWFQTIRQSYRLLFSPIVCIGEIPKYFYIYSFALPSLNQSKHPIKLFFLNAKSGYKDWDLHFLQMSV